MYDAKRGRRGIATYTAERDPYSADRLGLLAELRQRDRARRAGPALPAQGLARDRRADRRRGARALAAPRRGLLAPDEFVPLAERTGAVADLTRWVVDRALAQHVAWRDAGLDLPVAVNLAAANIVDVTLPAAVGSCSSATASPATGSSARSPSTP